LPYKIHRIEEHGESRCEEGTNSNGAQRVEKTKLISPLLFELSSSILIAPFQNNKSFNCGQIWAGLKVQGIKKIYNS
jgi:hypothetical protein